MTKKGDKARMDLHDMRRGPYIDDLAERQQVMDDAIKLALDSVTALEAKLEQMEHSLMDARANIGQLEARLENYDEMVHALMEEIRPIAENLDWPAFSVAFGQLDEYRAVAQDGGMVRADELGDLESSLCARCYDEIIV